MGPRQEPPGRGPSWVVQPPAPPKGLGLAGSGQKEGRERPGRGQQEEDRVRAGRGQEEGTKRAGAGQRAGRERPRRGQQEEDRVRAGRGQGPRRESAESRGRREIQEGIPRIPVQTPNKVPTTPQAHVSRPRACAQQKWRVSAPEDVDVRGEEGEAASGKDERALDLVVQRTALRGHEDGLVEPQLLIVCAAQAKDCVGLQRAAAGCKVSEDVGCV